jgi:hypothetical protein
MSARMAAAALAWLTLAAAAPARADIYSHMERKSGLTILSNIAPSQSAPVKSAAPATPRLEAFTPSAFPRVSAARQRTLDDGRRAILLAELSREQQSYGAAAAARAERDVLRRHQANIFALERELRAIP